MMYYLGIMQWVVIKLGWLLQSILGTTVCESVNAAANIFLGQSESPLLIRPYIDVSSNCFNNHLIIWIHSKRVKVFKRKNITIKIIDKV